MDNIEYVGVNELKDGEKADLEKLSAEYYGKIKRRIKNTTSLKIHIKDHGKGGKSKFSIHVHVSAPTRFFEATASDWDFARTLHIAFNEVEKQIEHAFHDDTKFYEHKG